MPSFPFLEVDVPATRGDELAYALMELGASGVELRDDTTFEKGPGQGQVRLVASFVELSAAEAAKAELSSLEPALSPRVDQLLGDAWRDRYKEYFRSFQLTERITVAPPWEPPVEAPLVLVLDPGRAFGTGLHATTSLVAQLLDEDASRFAGQSLLDVGTGSGILALSALVLGAGRVVAVDNDPDVIEVVGENAEANGLADRLSVSTTAVEDVAGTFAYVVANIRAPVIISMAKALAARLLPKGRLVVSGVLASEAEEVRAALEAAGLGAAGERRKDEVGPDEAGQSDAWVALIFER